MDIEFLVKLTARAWSLSILARLDAGVPGRQAPLLAATGAGRTAIAQSLAHLHALGLLELFYGVLQRQASPPKAHAVEREPVRIEDMATWLLDRVHVGPRDLGDLLRMLRRPEERVAAFLAALEMARLGMMGGGWPTWIFGKLGVWLVLGGASALLKKSMGSTWYLVLPAIGAVAAALAIFKPG